MSNVPSRQKWFIEGDTRPELQLDYLYDSYVSYMFNRTLRMFEYGNLPDGMITRDFEKFTQIEGKSFFIKHNDRFYVLKGAFENFITWNYEPKNAIIVNPALPDLKLKYTLDEDCVVIPNDTLYVGLKPLFHNNATQLASVDISLMYAVFNTRFKGIITANDTNDKASIDKVIEDLYLGRKLSAVAVNETLMKDTINVVPYNSSSSTDLKDLIEMKQYIKANWYIDLGINANYNMKRESINESEATMNDDALLPLIDDMFECRKRAVDKINEVFDLNITVELSSSWAKLREEINLENEIIKSEINLNKEDSEEPNNLTEEGKEDVSKTE